MRKFPKTFSDILTIEHGWPKKGNRLFRASYDWELAVTFSPHQLSRDAFIWDGYMNAGAVLIDEAERRPHQRFSLAYPIVFNYRHGLEAAMKWTIEQYGSLGGVELDDINHDLLDLWRKCKAIFLSAATSDEETLNAVEQVVKDFHDWDERAMAFRYSRNRNGATISLPDNPIDLQNMQRVLEAVDNFFKGADGMLSHIISAAPKCY